MKESSKVDGLELESFGAGLPEPMVDARKSCDLQKKATTCIPGCAWILPHCETIPRPTTLCLSKRCPKVKQTTKTARRRRCMQGNLTAQDRLSYRATNVTHCGSFSRSSCQNARSWKKKTVWLLTRKNLPRLYFP